MFQFKLKLKVHFPYILGTLSVPFCHRFGHLMLLKIPIFLSVGGAFSVDRCQNNEIVEPDNFFPISWLEASVLIEAKRTLKEWQEFFANAKSVDFFRSSMGNKRKVLRPQFYGARKPAYSYLGPNFCPLSYYSEKTF